MLCWQAMGNYSLALDTNSFLYDDATSISTKVMTLHELVPYKTRLKLHRYCLSYKISKANWLSKHVQIVNS